MFADSLVVIGLAVVSLGTIQEADGVQQRTFCLRNAGSDTTYIYNGYTSCGCTTIHFDSSRLLAPDDTTHVTLRFNPRGKGGEFYESGTVVYGDKRKRLQLAMTGECVTSEETLSKQFPVHITENTWVSRNRYDIGILSYGMKKELWIAVLHRDENNRKELIPVQFVVEKSLAKGLHHVTKALSVKEKEQILTFDVILDVYVK